MKKNKFRLSAIKLFITYSGIKKRLSKEKILSSLRIKIPVEVVFYSICEEKHKSGEYHYHCVLVLNSKWDCKNARKLDIKVKEVMLEEEIKEEIKEEKEIHGKYESCKNLNEAVKYTHKEDKEVLSNFEVGEYGQILDFDGMVVKYAREGKIKEIYKELERLKPRDVWKNDKNIERNLRNIEKRHRKNLVLMDKKKQKEFILPEELKKFIEEGGLDEKCLFMGGRSGTGKTEAAKYIMVDILKMSSEEVFFVNNIEGLKELKPEYKGVILDDVDITRLNGEDIIGLFDKKNTREITARYENIVIREGTKRIITSNKTLEEILKKCKNVSKEQELAIKRRVYEIWIENKLYSTINFINVEVNINKIEKGEEMIDEVKIKRGRGRPRKKIS